MSDPRSVPSPASAPRRFAVRFVLVFIGSAVLAWGSALALLALAPWRIDLAPQGTAFVWPGTDALPPTGIVQTAERSFLARRFTLLVKTHRYHEGVLEYWIDGAWTPAGERDPGEALDVTVIWHDAGWPFAGVHGGRTSAVPYFLTGPPQPGAVFGPIHTLNAGTQSERDVPLFPAWPGALGNTLIYTASLSAIGFLCFGLRRTLRGMQNRCLKCGYPTGDSTVCTECGAERAG